MDDVLRMAAKAGAKPQPSRDRGGRLFDPQDLIHGRRDDNEAAIRYACSNAYLGDRTAVCRVLGRYKMFVDTADVGLSTHLLLDGFWEMWVTEAMVEAVRPGMTVVDVGANLGYFTLLLADLVGPNGRVLAFEPNPPIAERLRRSLAVNGYGDRVTLHEIALTDEEDAQATLIVPSGEPKNAYVAPPQAGGVAAVPLRTRRMDAIAEAVDADFIKIDADTAEEAIWRGMAGLLAVRRPLTVFLEFAPARYADPGGFLDAITAHGFSLNLIDAKCGVRAVTRAQVLEGSPTADRMLALRR